MRPRMSVVPAGANGTMYLIGLLGQLCACATADINATANAAAMRTEIFMNPPDRSLATSEPHRQGDAEIARRPRTDVVIAVDRGEIALVEQVLQIEREAGLAVFKG